MVRENTSGWPSVRLGLSRGGGATHCTEVVVHSDATDGEGFGDGVYGGAQVERVEAVCGALFVIAPKRKSRAKKPAVRKS